MGAKNLIRTRFLNSDIGLEADLASTTLHTATKLASARDPIEFLNLPESKPAFSLIVKKPPIKEESKAAVEEALSRKKITRLVNFFIDNSSVTLRNFKTAQKLFLELFGDKESFQKYFKPLAQELDKSTERSVKYGKAHISVKGIGKLCLERSSHSLGYFKQYIAIDFDEKLLTTYTVWANKAKGAKLIKSKKHDAKKDANSIEFDAKTWKSFNLRGIHQNDYLKTLECIERNHLDLENYISIINKLELNILINGKLINNARISTNERDTSFLDFTTNTKQSVHIKITKDASSFVIS